MEPLLYLLLGSAVGFAMGWLLGSRRAAPADTALLQELRQQLAQRDTDLNHLRAQLQSAAQAQAAAEAGVKNLERAVLEEKLQREQAREELARLRDTQEKTARELSAAQADLRATRELLQRQEQTHQQAMEELRANHAKALQDLSDKFKALSLEALKATQPEFLRLATETLKSFQETAKGDLAQRQEAIAGLLKPLQESLQQYQQRLQQAETLQSKVLGEVKAQLESLNQQSATLAQETQQFRQVLRNSQARGKWGEETLRRVVEAAGMSSFCDFEVQMGVEGQRPDLVIKLPGERVIIVDAKVPELDYCQAMEEADPQRRAARLKDHAIKLKQTIVDLAKRNYPGTIPQSLDYVVLFLPAESLFSAALEGDRDLLIYAAQQKILLATPATLIALLRSVSVSWQYYQQNQNAQKIAEAAKELYNRVTTFLGHFRDLGEGLEKANKAFNAAVNSYQYRLRPQGERLRELGVAPSERQLREPREIEHALATQSLPAQPQS
ncbi:MAG: DNA recombination protein RmuC [Verrucomicrobiae bacterium]|nr:DNA recombination protein RmuC [Verrucomicrobiae bacterium]